MRKIMLALLLTITLSTAVLTSTYVSDSITVREHVAHAEPGWVAPFSCIAGTAIYLSGVIAANWTPSPWDWKFVWAAANIVAGAALNSFSCAWSLAAEHSDRAGCERSPSYYLGSDFYLGIPYNSYYRYGPCGVRGQ